MRCKLQLPTGAAASGRVAHSITAPRRGGNTLPCPWAPDVCQLQAGEPMRRTPPSPVFCPRPGGRREKRRLARAEPGGACVGMESADLGSRQRGKIWHRKPCPAARKG